ncbi:MAG: hypothetical protein A3F72_01385 [Bacteroidetes bacterium RIFCSPLOWO2_12_FULL_35_15]|nr:MAG: hypothetical protein A3F72_01385 [Bacteroidetes bacterium RIFCSPLOWO2_12_FULL_35_15]
MKNILFSLILISASLIFTSCNNATVSTGDGSNKVTGNGKVKSEQREINHFNKIEAVGVFNIILSQSDQESVKVETDENIQPLILTSVENEVLTISMKDSTSIDKMKKINIYISFTDLSKLNSTGVGSLKCATKLNLKEFELDAKGVGATELNIDAEKLTINSEIVGALVLAGTVKEVIINNKGLGAISAFDLKAENLSLRSEGVGAAEVYASNDLRVDVSGLGSVKYKGNPKTKNIKKEGLSKVERAD